MFNLLFFLLEQVINSNSVLARLTTSQKTYLQSIFLQRSCNAGEPVWIQGQDATEAVLVGGGKFGFARAQDLQPFSSMLGNPLYHTCGSLTLSCYTWLK
jgi:hypothetical protein